MIMIKTNVRCLYKEKKKKWECISGGNGGEEESFYLFMQQEMHPWTLFPLFCLSTQIHYIFKCTALGVWPGRGTRCNLNASGNGNGGGRLDSMEMEQGVVTI